MLQKFRNKVTNLLTNSIRLKRSESVKVQSKGKLLGVEKSRQLSTSKKKIQSVQITPKKTPKFPGSSVMISPAQTVYKDQNTIISEIIRKNKWIDWQSDVAEKDPSEQLLPTQNQAKQFEQLIQNSQPNISTLQKSNKISKPNQSNIFASQKHSKRSKDKIDIEQLEIQTNPHSKIDQMVSEIVVQGNNRQLQKNKHKRKKIPEKDKIPFFQQCMICGQSTLESCQTILLSCTHRIHQQCAMKMKWKNICKCNLCERKRIINFK